MSYDFLRRVDIDLGEIGDSVQIDLNREKKILRLTLFKEDRYQDEIKVYLTDEFGDLVEMARASAAHAQDKLALLKIIASLADRLSAAEECIDEIEDHLNRGTDNDWAREAIARYQEFAEEYKGEAYGPQNI